MKSDNGFLGDSVFIYQIEITTRREKNIVYIVLQTYAQKPNRLRACFTSAKSVSSSNCSRQIGMENSVLSSLRHWAILEFKLLKIHIRNQSEIVFATRMFISRVRCFHSFNGSVLLLILFNVWYKSRRFSDMIFDIIMIHVLSAPNEISTAQFKFNII